MADLEDFADSIRRIIPDLKWGSMRLWGQSLGRPGEDGHKLIGCEAVNDCLRLRLEDDEVLAIWNPLDVKITTKRFRIGSADSIRFTSYYCGRPKLPENILYRDYAMHDGLVRFRTNVEWVAHWSGWMHEATATSFPAVEIIFDPYASNLEAEKSPPKIQ
jgi:hypothetical protein